MVQNLTHQFNRLYIIGLSDQNAIEAYDYSISADNLGMRLEVDLVINQGNDVSAYEPDNWVTVILHGVKRKFIVTDTTKNVSGNGPYDFHMTMLEPVYLKTEYVPSRPIAYLSKTYEETTKFLQEDILYSLDYDVRLKAYASETSRRKGWKLSEIVHELGRAMDITIYFSGMINPYIGEFKIDGSFYEALVSLTKKHGLRPIYIPNITTDSGVIAIVDALNGRGYASGFAYINGANEVTEEQTSLPFPSYVEVIGAQEDINPITYDGAGTPYRRLQRKNLTFGNIRTYVPNRDVDSEGNYIFDTEESELSATTLSLEDWATGYKLTSTGDPYGETTDYSTDFNYYDPDFFGALPEAVTASTSQSSAKDLQLPTRLKTVSHQIYSNNYFGEAGPLLQSHTVTYVDSINGFDIDTVDEMTPRFVISYVEEAFNYGDSTNVLYEAPRYYSPIVVENESTGLFYVKTESGANEIITSKSYQLKRYNETSNSYTKPALLMVKDGLHIPYHMKLEYGRLPVPREVNSEDDNTSNYSNTKLVPIRLEMDFISYAEWYETAYTPGAVKISAKVIFEVVGTDSDGKKISMVSNKSMEEGEKYTLIPSGWNDFTGEQDWIDLFQPDCLVSLECTQYSPTGDGKSYQEVTTQLSLVDGALNNTSSSRVVFGNIPQAELKKRKEDIVEKEDIVSSYKETWLSVGDAALNLYRYTKAPLVIHDPSLISRHDAKTIARRFKYYYNQPVIKRTYTYDGIIPLSIGWGTVFTDIHGPMVPGPHNTSIGYPGQSRIIEGSNRRAMVTNVRVSRDGDSARTVIDAETLNI